MAADRKRVAGPEKSVAPIVIPLSSVEPDLFSLSLDDPSVPLRQDDRHLEQIRPLFARTGTVRQANGSAYLETGRLKVVCAVLVPHLSQTRLGIIPLTLVALDALAPAIRLDSFPKAVLDVHVLVLESDGGPMASLAAAVTCASLAVADAGVEMLDAVVASSAGFFYPPPSLAGTVVRVSEAGEERTLTVLDCDGVEERESVGSLFVACMPSLQNVTHLVLQGEINSHQCEEAINLCMDACSKVSLVTRETLLHGLDFKSTIEG
ncbi:ribosomal protein S5 domain 2-type protein [Zopfochytrium polystomum]|nr:ribosomal protein S5 domain 2-type protein [Zopfochytrium polystomum]